MNSSKARLVTPFPAQTVEAAPEIMGVCDAQGVLTYLNEIGRQWCGLAENSGDIPALAWEQLFPPAIARMIEEVALPAAARDGVWRGESDLRDREGRDHPVEQTIASIRQADGTVTGFSTVLRDLSARRSTEHALRESEERFSKAFYSSPDLYVIADFASGELVDVNDAFCRLFGVTRAEAIGKPPSALGLWKDLSKRDEFLESLFRSGDVREAEQQFVARSGQTLTCRVSAFRSEIGGRVCALFRMRDISQERSAELALRESEERFSKAFYHSPDPYVIADYDTGGIVDINDSFTRVFGWSRDDAWGKKSSELGLWADPAERDRFIEIFRRDGQVHEMEQHRRTKAGKIVLCQVTAFRITVGGRPHSLYWLHDISAERATELALRESEEKFSKAFLTSPDAMAVAEYSTGRNTEVNEAYCRLFEITREELLGHSGGELGMWGDPRDRDRYYELLNRDGSVREMEATKVKRNGERLICRITAHRLSIGGRQWLVTRILDITAQRRAEQALRESEEKFSKAFRASPDSVAIATIEDGRLIDVNEGFTRLHGWTREEAIGRTVRELGLWDDPAVRQRIIAELRTGKTVRNLPFVARDRHGGRHQCLYSGEITEIGGRDCLITIIRDVTEQQRLEEQLRHAQKMESVGQLAGGVAHDFNNILTVIQGHTSLLLDDRRLPPDTIEALRQIAQSAEFAANLTRQLLLFSRKQRLQLGPLDLNEVVARTSRLLRRVIGENITLEVVAAPGLPEINADAGMLEQVLLNLVVNARDAMLRGGRVTITMVALLADGEYVRRVPQARPGRFVGLRVSDTGEGIAPEILPRIFDPFFTTKQEGKGTGLGLATAYGIVEQHAGWIEVESQRGQGAQFTAWFPALAAPAAQPARLTTPPMKARGGETILVVEDKEAVRAIVQTVLVRFGYKVVVAENGEEALARWEEHRDQVGLLFTDVVMPGRLTGKDLADRLRAVRPGLKVIFCSGYDAEILDPEVLKAPGTRFLAKPFDVGKLAKIVRQLLDGG
jgi:PAS domain S-box-containing protein